VREVLCVAPAPTLGRDLRPGQDHEAGRVRESCRRIVRQAEEGAAETEAARAWSREIELDVGEHLGVALAARHPAGEEERAGAEEEIEPEPRSTFFHRISLKR